MWVSLGSFTIINFSEGLALSLVLFSKVIISSIEKIKRHHRLSKNCSMHSKICEMFGPLLPPTPPLVTYLCSPSEFITTCLFGRNSVFKLYLYRWLRRSDFTLISLSNLIYHMSKVFPKFVKTVLMVIYRHELFNSV